MQFQYDMGMESVLPSTFMQPGQPIYSQGPQFSSPQAQYRMAPQFPQMMPQMMPMMNMQSIQPMHSNTIMQSIQQMQPMHSMQPMGQPHFSQMQPRFFP
jgi:hypothetical protein